MSLESLRRDRIACFAGLLLALGFAVPSRLNAQGAASASGTVTDSTGAVNAPIGGTSNPTFGKITATTTSSRQIQFAVKLLF